MKIWKMTQAEIPSRDMCGGKKVHTDYSEGESTLGTFYVAVYRQPQGQRK